MYNLLIIGAGIWGQKYIETITSKFSQVALNVANRENWKQLIDARPDGVIIATPPQSHIEIATHALSQDIPTIIEKPLSLSLDEARSLEKFTAPILVNHIHLFSDSYQKIKSMTSGQIKNITTLGYNDGPVRNYSGLWDYAPHDLSMILDLAGCMPNKTNIKKIQISSEKSLFNIIMNFDNFDTCSTVGNGGNQKRRYFCVSFNGLNISWEDSDRPPNHTPPLENMLKVFLNAIDGKKDSRLGLDLSFKILEILAANK
jgi:predicted dehydrogenase